MNQTKSTSKKTVSEPKCIPLGISHVAIVDAELYDDLMHYRWRAVRYQRLYYARALTDPDRKKVGISMHRLIARTPGNMVCHHRNRNSLDNRRDNLVNLSRKDHELLHKNNTLQVKFSNDPGSLTHDLSGVVSGFGPENPVIPGNPHSGYD